MPGMIAEAWEVGQEVRMAGEVQVPPAVREWLCPRGHVLGQVRRRAYESGHVRVLALYRHAVDLAAEKPAAVEIIGEVSGQVTVRCDADGCEQVRTWYVGEDILREFLARRAGRA